MKNCHRQYQRKNRPDHEKLERWIKILRISILLIQVIHFLVLVYFN